MAAERVSATPSSASTSRRTRAAAEDSRGSPLRSPDARRTNRLKDAVYREMLRLESNHPGAEMALALSLLRAVVHAQANPEQDFQQWIAEVCTLGLNMIETSLKQHTGCAPSE